MSYDITLNCHCCGRTVTVERHEEGGTYAIGGTTEADLNVTWNYAQYYYTYINPEQGIRWLDGRSGKECADTLRRAIVVIEADEALERAELARVEEGRQRRAEELKKPDLDPMMRGILSSPGPTGYWLPTRENAARALRTLLVWAEQHPEAVFCVTN